uniref:Down syndrome cell adhesion molecule-like protein Dscam2 n=1 Tax=Rhabditophanes sp. KR3021 TaxID=114890 RepID=A0AC35U4F6_9BILA
MKIRVTLIGALLPILCFGMGPQRIAEHPSNATVYEGATTIFKCRVENQNGPVQWLRNGFGLGSDRDLVMFPKYEMIGSPARGEYNLKIINITTLESGSYECQVTAPDSSYLYRSTSNMAFLDVLVVPHDPVIQSTETNARTQHKNIKGNEGSFVETTCISTHAMPEPIINWAITKDENMRNIVSWIGEDISDVMLNRYHINSTMVYRNATELKLIEGDRFEYLSSSNKIRFQLDSKFDGFYLTCIVTHQTYEHPKTASLSLDINYKPKVHLFVSEISTLKENGEAYLTCDVSSKPPANKEIKWFQKGELISHAAGKNLLIEKLHQEDHMSEYACVATNQLGQGQGELTLNIEFAPTISSPVQTTIVDVDQDVVFVCEATGNPMPSLVWKKVGNEQVLGVGPTYSLKNIQKWQDGSYECTATSHGFKPAKIVHHAFVKGLLEIRANESVIEATGETAEIVCEIKGYPKPKTITWISESGENILAGQPNKRMVVKETDQYDGMVSKLTIRDIMPTDFGYYNCTANNDMGRVSTLIALKQKGFLQNMMTYANSATKEDFVIIIVVVFVVLVGLCTLLSIYYSCTKKVNPKTRALFKHENSKHRGEFEVQCSPIDDVHFATEDLLSSKNDSPASSAALVYNRDYQAISQNNPDMDFITVNNNYSNPMYQDSYHSPTNFDGYNGTSATSTFTPNGRNTPLGRNNQTMVNGIITLDPLREIVTPDNESGTLLLNSTDETIVRESPVSRLSTHV